MQTLIRKKEKSISGEKTIYMETMSKNRVCCRITESAVQEGENTYSIYGVELECKAGLLRFKESIEDFSDDIDTAVEFSQWLINYGVKPQEIYNAALVFLGSRI